MFSSVIPTRDWNQEQARVFSLFFRYYNWAKAAGSRLGELQRLEILLSVAAGLLVVFVIAFTRSRRASSRDLLVFAAVLLATALPLTGLYFRFWLPAIVCLAIFVGCSIADTWSEQTVMVCASLVLLLGLGVRVRAERPMLRSDVRMALGQSSRDEEYRTNPLWETWNYVNSATEPDAHVLMAAFYTTFGAASGGAFWVRRPVYTTDSHLQGMIQLYDWEDFLESIRKAAIEFVVISDVQFAAGRDGFSFTAGTNEYPFCRRLVTEYGTLASQYEHLQVYRLRTLDPTDLRLH
jgi:hypothetical protein